MAESKESRLPLRRMATDGMEHEIPIVETENWVKPIGGALEGFESRDGIEVFDSVDVEVGTSTVGNLILAELDPVDGYAPGTFLVAFQERGSGNVLALISSRASEGSFGYDDNNSPDDGDIYGGD